MGDNTKIEWSDATWNPVTGCMKVSAGCDHCYAETFAERWRGKPGHYFENGFDVQLRPDKLDLPLTWKKPRRIFVNSMSDLFHDKIDVGFIARVFAVMAATPHHTYQLLTKRHGRMRSLLNTTEFDLLVADEWAKLGTTAGSLDGGDSTPPWPLPNVWLGVSVENQQWADIRIPALLETPAAVRWISAEPLLDAVVLHDHWIGADPYRRDEPSLDWIVAGGESGPGARPMHPDWARALRDQCTDVGVPFLFKQWGEYVPAVVEDAPQCLGGRAYRDPRGGRSALVIRERGQSGTFRAGTIRPMRVGEATKATVLLDKDTIAVRVGKKAAGRDLDGRTWDQYPGA